METLDDYLNASPAEQRRIAREMGWSGHRAEYPGPLGEARTATRRFCEGWVPAHRGEPRNG